MAILRSPDNRLRVDLAVRAKGREAAEGVPAIRVRLDQYVLLNWSPLAPPGLPEQEAWRRVGESCVRTLHPVPEGAPALEQVVSFASARNPAAIAAITLRCAGHGIACRLATGWGIVFHVPRETQGLIADAAAPDGFARVPVAQALACSLLPVTCLYALGKCAMLRRNASSWALIAGDRPVDLPANRVRGWLIDEAPAPVTCQVAAAPAEAARFNCHVPFVISPLQTEACPMLWAAPGIDGVTPAHAEALTRVRALEWQNAAVRWLRGEIGDYLLVAEERGGAWQLSALTARARVWTVRLPFLEPGRQYRARWRHDPQPARPCFLPLPARMDAASRTLIHLADGGGFTLDLQPLASVREA
jgi:hypothetical protein